MKRFILLASATVLVFGTIAVADSHAEVDPAVKARQAHMQLYAHNITILGGMAQGKVEYDASLAQIAADNLAAVAGLDETTYWPEGTGNDMIEGVKALPAIWENMDDFIVKQDGMITAAAAMAEVAGTDLAAIQGAIRDLGGACSACHREYRVRDD
jgi:cytochrome c556